MIEEVRNHAVLIGRKNPCINSFILYLISLNSLTFRFFLERFDIDAKSLHLITSLYLSNKKSDSLREERTVLKVFRESKRICKEVLGNVSKKDLNLYSNSVEFLLLAILSLKEEEMPQAFLFLNEEDKDFFPSLREELMIFCLDKPSSFTANKGGDIEENTFEDETQSPFESNKILEEFADNLNIKALNGDFDGLVDYSNIIQKLYVTLCRSKKPNAIITGEGGVGKTALVEMLARNIVNGSAPEILRDKVIYSVNLSEMVAGTEYRGMFEKRLTNFIAEAKRKKNVILFFDEVHTLVGAGGGGRNNEDLEASNILKPVLARGEISCIGATTPKEYDGKIKNDPALERRFQRINLHPPGSDTMQEILPHLLTYYGKLHNVKYSKDFSNRVVEFCNENLPRKFFPDKLIDVIDFCGAKCKMDSFTMPPHLKAIENRLIGEISQEPENIKDLLKEFGDNYSEWEKTEKCGTVSKKYLEFFMKEHSSNILEDQKRQKFEDNLRKRVINQSNVDNFMKFVASSSFKTSHCPNIALLYGEKKSGKSFFLEEIAKEFRTLGKEVLELTSFNLSNLENLIGVHRSFAKRMMHYENPIVILDNINQLSSESSNILLDAFKTGFIETIDGDKVDISAVTFIMSCGASETSSVGFDSKLTLSPDIRPDLKEISHLILINSPSKEDKNKFVQFKLKQAKKFIKGKVKMDQFAEMMKGDFLNYGDINKEFEKVIMPLLEKKQTKKQRYGV